jgi:hypothetical protein
MCFGNRTYAYFVKPSELFSKVAEQGGHQFDTIFLVEKTTP